MGAKKIVRVASKGQQPDYSPPLGSPVQLNVVSRLSGDERSYRLAGGRDFGNLYRSQGFWRGRP